MSGFVNLDLFSVAVAVAAIGILGSVVYFTDRKSAINKGILIFSLVTVLWGISNYAEYNIASVAISFWLVRITLFLGVWQAFSLFQFLYIFPKTQVTLPRWYWFAVMPITAATSLLTLTPFVFRSVGTLSSTGHIQSINNGPGIYIFGAVSVGLVLFGLIVFLHKFYASSGTERLPMSFILVGVISMFALIVVFNFILPALFNISRFIPLGATFIFPFVGFAAYAILKHHLLGVKVLATEIFTFVLAVVSFADIIFSTSLAVAVFRSGVFTLVLVFGILLIKSVRSEIEQRIELERLDRELQEKNRQLDELSHFKSELLSLASHQIRSPLAAIKGFGTLIVGGSYGAVSDLIKSKVEQMGKSADNLIGLINTLLDVRKVEEGKMDYQMARTDLKKIVNDVVELLKPLAETKKLEFAFAAPDHEVWVNADAEKLKQVVQNLTDNAIKYTPSGFVHVELKEEPSPNAGQAPTAVVTVSDSGVGFSPDLAPHLFEEFIRDERVKKQILGTGLGLFIARKIAEAHGGTLWAESAGVDKGSAFHMKVPEVK